MKSLLSQSQHGKSISTGYRSGVGKGGKQGNKTDIYGNGMSTELEAKCIW